MSPWTDAELIHHLAVQLWWSVIACETPWHRLRYERMRAPRIGDLVVETTSSRAPTSARIGRLIRRAHEPLPDWDDARDGPNAGEDVWYIETNGGEARWTNASFVALPPPMLMVGAGNAILDEGWPP